MRHQAQVLGHHVEWEEFLIGEPPECKDVSIVQIDNQAPGDHPNHDEIQAELERQRIKG